MCAALGEEFGKKVNAMQCWGSSWGGRSTRIEGVSCRPIIYAHYKFQITASTPTMTSPTDRPPTVRELISFPLWIFSFFSSFCSKMKSYIFSVFFFRSALNLWYFMFFDLNFFFCCSWRLVFLQFYFLLSIQFSYSFGLFIWDVDESWKVFILLFFLCCFSCEGKFTIFLAVWREWVFNRTKKNNLFHSAEKWEWK